MKLELGVLILLLPLVWLVTGRLVASPDTQILVLAGFSTLAAAWLVVRTRRAVRRWRGEHHDGEAGP